MLGNPGQQARLVSSVYQITEILPKRRVVLQLDQFGDHDRNAFMRDMKQAALNVRALEGYFDILADFSNSIVMPRDIADDSEDMAAWFISNGLRRSANVSQSVTQQMQIRRVTRHDTKFAIFRTRAEAESWLDE